ncbi:lipopolysaccharide assembly protein LapA domain-containing protein [uncultured Reyranella sp.]|uniref:lipopolysaccharide assembly protein LapA domain-containing protein n=1 Tax=uncultured Reyranella sp. TaxID=735512 RepID=UPI0025D2B152|nr:lipopolysaccharide assembly protein LapA domain-containing protein [uncultured Reyranella sp.]
MKILSRVLFLLFILIGVLVAVSNAQPVQLALWPLPHIIVMPVYLLVIAMLMLGVLAGLGMGWWAGRHHRRRAREAGGEAARLDREVARLRAAQAVQQAAPAGPAPRDQRALERQSALVAPELGSQARRGPFS